MRFNKFCRLLFVLPLLYIQSCQVQGRNSSATEDGTIRYTTFVPSADVARKIVREHFAVTPHAAIETHLMLKKDSTFIVAYCDRQIYEVGKYHFDGNHLFFTDIYNFEKKEAVPNRAFFYDKRKEQLLFVQPRYLLSKGVDSADMFTIMRAEKNKRERMRNEELPHDSLLKYNQYWEKPEQLAWLDSVVKAEK